MNKIDILLGLQWGDEGKGKVVDALTPNYDIVCRFQGGPNAGHTIEFEGRKFVLHNIPSGVLTPGCLNLIGNGVIIDPHILKGEIEGLREAGFDLRQTLLIANRAHLILPTHRAMDAANEKALGKMKVGTTLKGIGPTYTDKTARRGLRIGDINTPDFREKDENLKRPTNSAKSKGCGLFTGSLAYCENDEAMSDRASICSKRVEAVRWIRSSMGPPACWADCWSICTLSRIGVRELWISWAT